MRIVLLSLCFAVALASRTNDENKTELREFLHPPKGMIGVASVAGMTNRNGRVSSLTGVKLIPGDSPVTITNDGSPYLYPLTVTKEVDGKYASGSIQYYPGTVMVSSSAGYGPDLKMWPKIMPLPSNMFLQHPLNLFETPKRIDPWFPKDMFKAIQPRQFQLPTNWIYPQFDPFYNLWR